MTAPLHMRTSATHLAAGAVHLEHVWHVGDHDAVLHGSQPQALIAHAWPHAAERAALLRPER